MSLVPARNGANAPPSRSADLAREVGKTSTKGKVPTGYAEEIAISEQSFRSLHREVQSQQSVGKKRKRETKGDSGTVYGAGAYKGPWAKYEERMIDSDSGEEVEVSGDESGEEVVYEEDAIAAVPGRGTFAGTGYAETSAEKESSTFEGTQERDYQGRTYMHVPQDLDVDLVSDMESLDIKCFTPKKLVHTFKSHGKNAHEKALTSLKFIPNSGHLLLSAAADGKVKLWDVYHNRELLRTYNGHTKSTVDVDFTPDGTKFVTASYDKQMKVWDTETGQCTGRFSTGSTPHVIRWQPEDPSGKEFLAGMHDNKIVQFDTRAEDKKPVQEYDHHLGPVNTITFLRREPTIHHNFRRQVTARLGIRHSRSYQVHRRAVHVPHGQISDASEGLYPLAIIRQHNQSLLSRRQDPSEPQEGLQRPQQRGLCHRCRRVARWWYCFQWRLGWICLLLGLEDVQDVAQD